MQFLAVSLLFSALIGGSAMLSSNFINHESRTDLDAAAHTEAAASTNTSHERSAATVDAGVSSDTSLDFGLRSYLHAMLTSDTSASGSAETQGSSQVDSSTDTSADASTEARADASVEAELHISDVLDEAVTGTGTVGRKATLGF